MAIKRVSHKGFQIVVVDFRGSTRMEQQLQLLEELAAILKTSLTGVRMLANFEGISIGPEFMARSKELGKQYEQKILRQAYVGIAGLKNILLQGYATFTSAKNLKSFEKEADALDWLVS